jgi:hypothetical protein
VDNVNYKGFFASDIEANGLLDQVTKVWCIVSQDIETNEFFIFHDYPEFDNQIITDPVDGKTYTIPKRKGSLIEGTRFWYKIGMHGGKIVCHNSLSYDKPLLEMFYPKCIIPVASWYDTLIQSKVQWYDRPCPKGARGTHGLQAYGVRLGVEKPEINDWSSMDIMKLHRCIEDVKIQVLTYKYLEKERLVVKEKLGIDFSEAIENEVNYRINATKQEKNGAAVDVPFMHSCIAELDKIVEELRDEIEPQLPKQTKPKSTKISKSELGELLGLKLKDSHSIKDGVAVVDKPYYKPTTNIFKKDIRKGYQGFYKDRYKTDTFVKLKKCRDFIKENYPETNLKDWTIDKKEDEFTVLTKNVSDYFDIPTTSDFVMGPFTKVDFNETTLTQGDVVKSFLVSQGWKNAPEWTLKKDKEGQFVRAQYDTEVRWPEKPLYGDSANQLVRLVKRGQPLVVAPKLTEECYEELPEGLGKKIADYNTYQHRRRFLMNDKDDEKGLLNLVRPDGRITCGINNSATSTLRSSHSTWVNAPGAGALYGEEIRSCIIAPEGKVLVGADMKSAQLSIAAYYANNYDYYLAVADGKEIKTDEFGNELIHPKSGKPWYLGESGHCVNARAFTLVSDEEWKRAVETQDQELIHHISLLRKKSKGGSFATIFGASGKKVAQTLGIPEAVGEAKKQAFLSNIGLDEVIKILQMMVAKNSRCDGGYIELPFGYYTWCKAPHKVFNYLDQGTEAACQKWAVNYFEEKATKLGLRYKKILDYHDEYAVEADEDCAEEVGRIMVESYHEASVACWEWHKKHSKWFTGNSLPHFMFDLAAGFKVGKSYWGIH